MAFMVLLQFGFCPEAMFAGAVKIKSDLALKDGKTAEVASQIGQSIMGPGNFIKDPISAISFGMALMFGTAGLPHILMRFFTVPNAKAARNSVMWATGWIGYFYLLTFIIGFGAITFVLTEPAVPRTPRARCWAAATWRRSTWPMRSAATSSSASSRRWPSPPSWRWSRA